MPRAALTQPEIEAFRDEIIRAASRLFAERGYEAVTMRSLAAELGCSPMTPYRYFDGKAEIFAMVKADAYRRFADAEEAAAATAADPAARLTVLARAYVDFALAEPDAYRIMFELAQAADDAYPELQAQARRAWGALRDAVGAAVAAGLIAGDADDVAHLYWAQVHGLVALHLAGKLTLGRTLEELLQALLDQNARGRRPSC
jgi:AcrR family transcriptional regulator